MSRAVGVVQAVVHAVCLRARGGLARHLPEVRVSEAPCRVPWVWCRP